MFLYLPQGVARQLVYEEDLSRLVVTCQVIPAEILHLFGGQLGVVAHHHGGYLLPVLLIGQSHHGDLGDARVSFEHLLDLARVDVVSAADDQLLCPPAYGEVPVLADPAEILRAEPPVPPKTSSVASGRFQYPLKTCEPRTS